MRVIPMRIDEALKLFDIQSISGVDRELVKKQYRKLMKLNHPDLHSDGSDYNIKSQLINEAKQTLDEALAVLEQSKLNTKDNSVFIVKFGDLLKVYSGATLTFKSDTKEVNISKENIKSTNMFIDIGILAIIDSDELSVSTFTKIDQYDRYTISFKVKCTDIDKDIPINIQAYGKNVNIILKRNKINLILKYDYGVELTVTVERQLIVDET